MSRIHVWYFLKDSQGRPVENADLNLYLANTKTEAIIYESRTASAAIDQSTWSTGTSGFFEYYIGDEFEISPSIGYSNLQKFDLFWQKLLHTNSDGSALPVSGSLASFTPFWPLQRVDETDAPPNDSERIAYDKMISNQLAYDWNYHQDNLTYVDNIHGVYPVDYFDPNSGTKNKLVSNNLMNTVLADLQTLLVCGGAAIDVQVSYGPEKIENWDMEEAFQLNLPTSGWSTTGTDPVTKQIFKTQHGGLASLGVSANMLEGVKTNTIDNSTGDEWKLEMYMRIPTSIPIIPALSEQVKDGTVSLTACAGVPSPSGWGFISKNLLYPSDASIISSDQTFTPSVTGMDFNDADSIPSALGVDDWNSTYWRDVYLTEPGGSTEMPAVSATLVGAITTDRRGSLITDRTLGQNGNTGYSIYKWAKGKLKGDFSIILTSKNRRGFSYNWAHRTGIVVSDTTTLPKDGNNQNYSVISALRTNSQPKNQQIQFQRHGDGTSTTGYSGRADTFRLKLTRTGNDLIAHFSDEVVGENWTRVLNKTFGGVDALNSDELYFGIEHEKKTGTTPPASAYNADFDDFIVSAAAGVWIDDDPIQYYRFHPEGASHSPELISNTDFDNWEDRLIKFTDDTTASAGPSANKLFGPRHYRLPSAAPASGGWRVFEHFSDQVSGYAYPGLPRLPSAGIAYPLAPGGSEFSSGYGNPLAVSGTHINKATTTYIYQDIHPSAGGANAGLIHSGLDRLVLEWEQTIYASAGSSYVIPPGNPQLWYANYVGLSEELGNIKDVWWQGSPTEVGIAPYAKYFSTNQQYWGYNTLLRGPSLGATPQYNLGYAFALNPGQTYYFRLTLDAKRSSITPFSPSSYNINTYIYPDKDKQNPESGGSEFTSNDRRNFDASYLDRMRYIFMYQSLGDYSVYNREHYIYGKAQNLNIGTIVDGVGISASFPTGWQVSPSGINRLTDYVTSPYSLGLYNLSGASVSAETPLTTVESDTYQLTFFTKADPSQIPNKNGQPYNQNLIVDVRDGSDGALLERFEIDGEETEPDPHQWQKHNQIYTFTAGTSASVRFSLPTSGAYKIDKVNLRKYVDKSGSAPRTNALEVSAGRQYRTYFKYRFLDASDEASAADYPNRYVNKGNVNVILQAETGNFTSQASASNEAQDNDDTGYCLGGVLYNGEGDGVAVGRIGSGTTAYVKWDNVVIPQGATLSFARIRYRSYSSGSVGGNVRVYFENTGNANTQVSDCTDLGGRSLTSDSSVWAIDDTYTFGDYYTSDDISAPLQEVVNRSDWESGNSVMTIISNIDCANSNYTTMWSQDSTNEHPVLEYGYYIPEYAINETWQLPSGNTGSWYEFEEYVWSSGACPSAALKFVPDTYPATFELDDISFYAEQIGPGQRGTMYIVVYDGDGNVFTSIPLTSGSGYSSWGRYQLDFSGVPSGVNMSIGFESGVEPIYFYIDDVSLKQKYPAILVSTVDVGALSLSGNGTYFADINHLLKRTVKYPVVQVWDKNKEEIIRPLNMFDIDKRNIRVWFAKDGDYAMTTSGEVSGVTA